MKTLSFVLAFLALAVPAQAETVWLPSTGCTAQATAARAFRLLSDGDQAGHDRFAKEKTASGECVALRKDTRITVETMSLEDGLVCAKAAGAASCLWMPLGAIH